MSAFLSTALPLAQSTSTNTSYYVWDAPRDYIPLPSNYEARTPTPTPTTTSSNTVRRSYEMQRNTQKTPAFDREQDDNEEEEEEEEHGRSRSPKPIHHAAHSSLSLTQAFYLSSATTVIPPPIPPFTPVLLPPKHYTPSPSPAFDANLQDLRSMRVKRPVKDGVKKQLKRIFSKRRSESAGRAKTL